VVDFFQSKSAASSLLRAIHSFVGENVIRKYWQSIRDGPVNISLALSLPHSHVSEMKGCAPDLFLAEAVQ
jgi:hypothetical protein